MSDWTQAPRSRRGLLALALAGPLLWIGTTAGAQEAAVCVKLDTLPASQKSMRRSLSFKLETTDPKKRRASCTFFTSSGGACGKCQLLSGGAVAAVSVCDNWTAKSGS